MYYLALLDSKNKNQNLAIPNNFPGTNGTVFQIVLCKQNFYAEKFVSTTLEQCCFN